MHRLVAWFLIVMLSLPAQTWAAVAFGTDVEGVDNGGAATTLTLSNVLGTTGDLIIAFFSWRKNTTQAMTGATYGGAAMTQICTEQAIGGGAIAAWYYTGATGTQNVVGTWNAAPGNIQGSASVLTGADISGTPLGTAACATFVSATSNSGAVTIPAGGMAIDGMFIRSSPTGITPNAGQTQRASQASSSSMYYQASTEPDSGDGTLGWTWTVSNTSGQIIVPILPAAAGGAATFGFRLRLAQ